MCARNTIYARDKTTEEIGDRIYIYINKTSEKKYIRKKKADFTWTARAHTHTHTHVNNINIYCACTILTHARPETRAWCTFKLWEKRGMKYASLSPARHPPSVCVWLWKAPASSTADRGGQTVWISELIESNKVAPGQEGRTVYTHNKVLTWTKDSQLNIVL